MDMPFIPSYEEIAYEDLLARLMTRLRNDALFPKGVFLYFWCSRSYLLKEWFLENNIYWARNIDVEISFREHQEEWSQMFVGWNIVKVLAVPPARRGKVSVSIPNWQFPYDATRVHYVLSSPVLSYCTGIYNNCQDDKRRVENITRTENSSMKIADFFASCRNGNSSHYFEQVQFDQHHGGILVPSPTELLEDVEVFTSWT